MKKENQELKRSLEFTQAQLKNALDKDIEYENKLDGLKRRTNETDEYIEGTEDQLEYLENQSRRNNVKIMGVDEDLEEKTWDPEIREEGEPRTKRSLEFTQAQLKDALDKDIEYENTSIFAKVWHGLPC